MSPPGHSKSTNQEGKPKFSLRWFFPKTKNNARPSREASTQTFVPSSRSCEMTIDHVDRYPKYLLWKFLPGKSSSSQNQIHSRTLPFRSSFSCNDVHNLCLLNPHSIPANRTAIRAVKDPCHSLYNLCKSQSGLAALETDRTMIMKSQDLPAHSDTVCKLCLVTFPISSMYRLKDCKCVFCISCLYQYLNFNIKEGNVPVTCPDADCSLPGKILVSEIKDIAGTDALALFERYKLNLDVELDPAKVWCPSPGCETVCSFQPATNPNMGAPAYCVTCKFQFCSLCKLQWHGKDNCQKAKKILNDDSDMSVSDEESWIKQCPNCRVPIEKDEGCAQMMCYRCKHVFCWHCLASLDDDFLLRHYDKGPCRNKLGHSRASMIWHRTQVIGIFAGFSFLLLMASPVLLLAAPCFLCCRCKNKFFYEEATNL